MKRIDGMGRVGQKLTKIFLLDPIQRYSKASAPLSIFFLNICWTIPNLNHTQSDFKSRVQLTTPMIII